MSKFEKSTSWVLAILLAGTFIGAQICGIIMSLASILLFGPGAQVLFVVNDVAFLSVSIIGGVAGYLFSFRYATSRWKVSKWQALKVTLFFVLIPTTFIIMTIPVVLQTQAFINAPVFINSKYAGFAMANPLIRIVGLMLFWIVLGALNYWRLTSKLERVK